MAYTDNFPQRPVFMADFANGGRIDPRITFSRLDTASSGNWSAATNSPGLADGSGTANQYYRVSAAGVQDLGSGSISFEVGDYIKYSGSVWFKTTQPISVTYWSNEKHLSSENLIKHSEGTSTWGGDATVTYNYTNGPDGVTGTALRLQSASGTERYRYSSGGQFASGQAYTVSCWVKSNTGVAQTFKFFVASTGVSNRSGNLTTHATDWTRMTATITPTSSNLFSGFVFDSASTYDISVWGLQVNTGSSALDYQPTTTQIHREYAPTLKSVSTAGQPRFEYSPTDSASEAIGQSRGLLIEGQATNINTYSKGGVNGSGVVQWQVDNGSATGNSAVGPDGTLSALHFVPNTTTTAHYAYNNAGSTPSGSTPHTISVYAKAAGYSDIVIRLTSSYSAFANTINATFTLTGDGSVSVTGGTATAAIESCGNGWYRCQVTETTGSSPTGMRPYIYARQVASYAGDGFSGVLLWGWQIEANSFASSFVDTGTSGSTATRAADSAAIAVSDITGFSEGVGTIVCETGGVASATATNQLAFSLDGSTYGDWTQVGVNAGGTTDSTVRVWVRTPDGDQAFFSSGTATVGTGYKLACRYELDNVAASLNGGAVASDTSGKVPTSIDTLWLGQIDGTNFLNSNLKRLALYGEALSDTNLQALTS